MKSLALSILFFSVFMTETITNVITIPPVYDFDQKITMTVKTSNEDAIDIDYFFNSKNTSILCMRINVDEEIGSAESIYFIFKDDKIEMLMNISGMRIRKTITKEEFNAFSNLEEIPEQSGITKTGNSKTILGYSCHEYKTTTDEGSLTFWISPKFPIDNSFAPMLGMRTTSPFNGFVMELYTTASTEKANLKITNVDLNTTLVLDTSLYKNFKF